MIFLKRKIPEKFPNLYFEVEKFKQIKVNRIKLLENLIHMTKVSMSAELFKFIQARTLNM